jgi:integrase
MDVFLELDAATGARRGELLGLQWTDLQGNQLMIGHSLSQVGQQVFLKEPTISSCRRAPACTRCGVRTARTCSRRVCR